VSATSGYENWSYSSGGLELYARIYPGEGPPLLLMHGLTRNSADFEPLAAHLAGRFNLVVPDQRGRGLSGYDPDPANYRPDVYAADMFALLASLAIPRAGLIGTSMGGLMAFVMAAIRPDLVSSMILNDVGPYIEPAGLARIGSYVGSSAPMANWDDAANRCAAINAEAFPDFTHTDWLRFARRTCRQQGDGTISFAYDPAIASGVQSTAVPPDIWPLWDALATVPVLLLRGEHSDVFSTATADAMAQRHSGEFTYIEVPGRGHAPLLDEPAALAAIDAFLAAQYG
jgi:pimeloyl-ACP methyl ester carboxylesterase